MQVTQHRSKHVDGGLFTCERIKGGDLSGGYHCHGRRLGDAIFMNYLYYTKREAVQRFKQHLLDTYGQNFVNNK